MAVTLADLAAELPDGVVVTDPDILASYRQDRAADPAAGTPLAVVRPTRTEEVQAVLRWATAHRIAVVPRGAGTGLSGGATAVDGGIVLSTEKMRDITVDPVTRTAVVQPGLLNAEVKKAVAEHGLWYPPDPSSYEICSIGGNIATNAGGLCCVKYGVTTDYVLGLQVVLADGTAVRLGGPRLKDVAGLSLTKLFVGSEGTLGVITEVTLRLLPPQHIGVHGGGDLRLGGGRRRVRWSTITGKIRPSMLEFMDSVAINAVEDKLRMGLDRTAAAMMVAASDDRGAGRCRGRRVHGPGVHRSRCHRMLFDRPTRPRARRSSRPAASPSRRWRPRARCCSRTSGCRCPRWPSWSAGSRRSPPTRDLTISVIAHAGDGNTHPLIVYDPTDAAMTERAHEAFGEIMDLAVSLGGTITGEHGVGRLKKPWLAGQLGPEAMELNRRIKAALDPDGILNPGAVV